MSILLVQLLELQLQPGVLCFSLVELAPAGRQYLGVEMALNLCPARWTFAEPDLKAGRGGPHQGLCSQLLPSCPGLLLSSLQLPAQGCPADMGMRLSQA